MLMRNWIALVLPLAATVVAAEQVAAQAPAFAPPQIAYVERMETTYRPAQQRVIVPVVEYRTETRLRGWWNPFREPQMVQQRVPVTHWEERIQTSYAPVTERRYRPVLETSGRVMPPLQLATRPQSQPGKRSHQLHDDLPMVAVQAPPPRTAQVPSATLVPQGYKPAARGPSSGARPLTPR